jgi:glycine reductase
MGMREALLDLGRVAIKRAGRQELSVARDHLIARGLRVNFQAESRGAARAIDMALRIARGESVETEYEMPSFDRVTPAAPVPSAAQATIAVVTSGGIVPRGNPDRIESASASKFGCYSFEDLERLSPEDFQSVHGGYDPSFANEDPNRVVPLDALRALERRGAIGRLHDRFYSTVGNSTSVEQAVRFGEEIAAELVNEGVQAVILTST